MQSRRNFLQKGLLATAVVGSPATLLANNQSEIISLKALNVDSVKRKSGKITFLQTTDVHCQLHAHDELFWENEKLTFRKTGGLGWFIFGLHFLRVLLFNIYTFSLFFSNHCVLNSAGNS